MCCVLCVVNSIVECVLCCDSVNSIVEGLCVVTV